MDSAGAGGSSGKLFDEMPRCPSDQECPRRRRPSPAVKDSGYDGSGVVSGGMPQARSRSEFDAGVSLWAGLQPDILGVVLHFLPSLSDRASVRCVCRHWRTGARGHVLPVPLPILVLPEFKFSSLSDKGDLMTVRRVPVPKEVGADDLRCVGSFDGWLVGVTPSKDRTSKYYRDSDGDCFLVNAFSSKIICLPQLFKRHFDYSSYSGKSIHIVNSPDDTTVDLCANDTYTMSLCQVVLSASPDSGSKYIVAASSYYKCSRLLAFWQPGMMLWHVYSSCEINGPTDLTFYQGKLYVLLRRTKHLFAFEFEDDDGFMVSRVELCLTEPPLHPLFCDDDDDDDAICCNIVVWRGELLLIIRHYNDDCRLRQVALRVEVFALDVNANPKGLSEIHSFDGDCIFVGSGGCKSFPAGLHDGVDGDLIYFVPDDGQPYDRFVYSMRDGTMKPFAAKLFVNCLDVPRENLDFPVWLLPTERCCRAEQA